ncbi:hypothetical protein ACEPAF_9953 [Sanghuangporus sanghuang]
MALSLYRPKSAPDRVRSGHSPVPRQKPEAEVQQQPTKRSTSSSSNPGSYSAFGSGVTGRGRSYSASTTSSDKASKQGKQVRKDSDKEELVGTAGRNKLRSKSHSRSASAPGIPTTSIASVILAPPTRTSRTIRTPRTTAPAAITTTTTTTTMSTNAALLSYLEEQLFAFSKIPLGDFESIMAWIELHSHHAIDYQLCKEKMLWQTYKTFERLLRRDFEERHVRLVQEFANQCVQTLAILDYAADCGYENLRKYVRNLVLTPEMARMNYLARMMKLPPQERLEFITRPVPGHLEKLKWFCLLYDHLYEKIEQETRHRMEKTLLDKFHTRLENVQARLSRGANTLLNSPDGEVGRAL